MMPRMYREIRDFGQVRYLFCSLLHQPHILLVLIIRMTLGFGDVVRVTPD